MKQENDDDAGTDTDLGDSDTIVSGPLVKKPKTEVKPAKEVEVEKDTKEVVLRNQSPQG